LYTSPVPSLFLSGLSWHVYKYPINAFAMNEAALLLLEPEGSSDMSAFRKSRSAASHTHINVMDAFVVRSRPHIVEIEVTADWFVYGMMRFLAAALVEVGRGSWSLADFRRIVEQGDRAAVKHSAPAAGLCLLEVGYAAEKYPFQDCEVASNLMHLGLSDVERVHP
jgi:tRNA pseudouridine38-40 synthase